ncbi:MAG: DEAD/DEAH box helicase family protein [Deltaproteobacteria bacterium]|nr:DEAD/DEAH box helicase family protein [Deltaproteobacteria bacterium]
MSRIFLKEMVNDIRFDNLPANWNSFDLRGFSEKKSLWDYQQKAIENAIKVFWNYYEGFGDYQKGEGLEVNKSRKERFLKWYKDNGQDKDLDIGLRKANRNISNLLFEYYEVKDGKVPYECFMNRMCFWMATGSGKTLVLVKLIQVLRDLIHLGEIPPHDILVLTHRDDLIDQLKWHVNEFNSAQDNVFIKLRELKEYATAKREHPSLFKDQELTVFYYRSDNLSDEQKEKIIDFRNYDDEGKWYILLDEAHKGDKEESKRQHIYSILSRNGFMFNFSATFTDPRDLLTTVFNFNLSEFIRAGYGKHISILRQEIRAFKDNEDYNNEEKQKVVLKSLIMLAYTRKFYEDIRYVEADPSTEFTLSTFNTLSAGSANVLRTGLYHKPLLLTLVNSVNTEDADLKLFFRELERIGKDEISDEIWQLAKEELWNELKDRPSFMFEDTRIEIEYKAFQNLSQGDILEYVYNSSGSGEIEILVRPSNRQELAFKLKTSDRPFALIKIGDISGWLKEELAGYEVNESFEDESYFERLNEDDSDINILMGSRSFYEGWDSNRPNVVNFINIGIGTDAKKFILQSVGRGVRIEPLKNKRKRLLPLFNARELDDDLFQKIKEMVLPIETLFIFGTNRSALQAVIGQLDLEKEKEAWQQLSLFINDEAKKQKLLVPTYKLASQPLIQQREPAKFPILKDELELLKRYINFVGDERVLLAIYDTEPQKIKTLSSSLGDVDRYYKDGERSFKNLNLLFRRILDYFDVIPEEFEGLKKLEDEINHFKNIRVSLKDISELSQKIDIVRQYVEPSVLEKELGEKFSRDEITLEQYKEGIKQTTKQAKEESVEYEGKGLKIKHVANHYYIPLILSEEEKVDYIKHIIKIQSEVKFINYLEQYLQRSDCKLKEFDAWIFSKLDESLDEVYIPYYNPKTNNINHFKPDFIFWLERGDDYFILFVDPKGTEYTDYQHKIDGYRNIFEENDSTKKALYYDGLKVRLFTFLYTADVNILSQGYKEYWFDNIGTIITKVLDNCVARDK